MKRILIINGPNLNLLGTRQPEIYGNKTLDDIKTLCEEKAQELNISIDFRQSNHEGVMVDWIHETKDKFNGLIINAGAYTHTSIALLDAIIAVEIPTIELHLSNILEREKFRHTSYIGFSAFACIMGHGAKGYVMALDEMVKKLSNG